MTISEFVFVGWIFCFMVSGSSLAFGEYDGCMFSLFFPVLVCSQRMPTGFRGLATGKTWGKKGGRKRCLGSLCDGVREEIDTRASFQLQR